MIKAEKDKVFNMKKYLIFIIIAGLLCIFLIIREPKEIKYFPDFKDWIKISKFEVYNRFNIKNYVGIAEHTYIKYGFKKLFHQEYINNYNYIIVDIFKMKNKKAAKTLVNYIINPNDRTVKIAEIATKSPTQVIFLKKSYYVRVYMFSGGYKTENELLKFAKYIDSRIG